MRSSNDRTVSRSSSPEPTEAESASAEEVPETPEFDPEDLEPEAAKDIDATL